MWKISVADRENIQVLRAKGMTLKDIGKRYGVSPDCIRYNLYEKVRSRRSETSKDWRAKHPLTEEDKIKRRVWFRLWFRSKYHNDEEFRTKYIKKVSDWQKEKKRKQNNKPFKNNL